MQECRRIFRKIQRLESHRSIYFLKDITKIWGAVWVRIMNDYGVKKRIFCLTFLKKRNIIAFERVANQRKSSFAALLYYTVKKCVAYQRKSNL